MTIKPRLKRKKNIVGKIEPVHWDGYEEWLAFSFSPEESIIDDVSHRMSYLFLLIEANVNRKNFSFAHGRKNCEYLQACAEV